MMNQIAMMAAQYGVSATAIEEMMRGVQRRFESLSAEDKQRCAEDREFGMKVMDAAVKNYFEVAKKMHDQYMNDAEYRAEVIADVKSRI